MKHKTWFRLIVKAIGLLLIGMGLPGSITAINVFLQVWRAHLSAAQMGGVPPFFGPNSNGQPLLLNILAGSLQLLLGLYLFFGGRWVVNLCIPSNRPYCPDCGYPLRNVRGDACPECGAGVRHLLGADRSPS